MNFQVESERYADAGWVSIPLTYDSAGYAKRPITMQWTSVTLDTVADQLWDKAAGIGLVLGEASNGLGVIDVDDADLMTAILVALGPSELPLWVRTARNRGHIYIQQDEPTGSSKIPVMWKGIQLYIEIKSTGTQVAAPPTPNYKWMNEEPLWPAPNIWMVWEYISEKLSNKMPESFSYTAANTTHSAGYPQPWQAAVPQGERNNALFIEAHKLRQAQCPENMAVQLLIARVSQSYETGQFSEEEVRRTVESAYRKGVQPRGDHLGFQGSANLIP